MQSCAYPDSKKKSCIIQLYREAGSITTDMLAWKQR